MQIRMVIVGLMCAVGLASCAPVPAVDNDKRDRWIESIKVNILGMPKVPHRVG